MSGRPLAGISRAIIVLLAVHRRQVRYLQILLLLTSIILLVIDEPLGLPGWLPLLLLGTWMVVASCDMVVFPGLRGIARQAVGVVVLGLGIFAIVISVRLMIG